MGTAIEPHSEEYDDNRLSEEALPVSPVTRAAARPSHAAGGLLGIVKPKQGIHVRWGTAIGAGALAAAGAYWVWEQIQVFSVGPQYDVYFHLLVPVVLLLAALYGIYRVVGRNLTVIEFMSDTEGEMKKVNWSTRREVWGATKVVIVTVLALGLVLAVVDAFFMLFFGAIDVLKNVKVLDLFRSVGGEG